jgi:predicted AAA+ superfamily ATPase
MPSTFIRHSRAPILAALNDTRAVYVMGARQVGKSTLTGDIAKNEYPATALSLDNRGARDAASSDPDGFVAGLARPVLLDEIQRAGPDLLLAIKAVVDADKSPGQFLLTGSANVLTNRKAQDALTGRIEIVTLWPLSQSEIEGTSGNIVDSLFAAAPPRISDAPVGREAFVDRIAAGGYPEALKRRGARRAIWFENYLRTTLDRDLRDVSDGQKLGQVPRLLKLLAGRAASLLNSSDVGKRLRLEHKTVRSYTTLLETVFLVKTLPAWRPSIGARESTTRKVYVVDSGLLAHLLGADPKRLAEDERITGMALENFVAMEVMKHLEWASTDAGLFHYRTGNDEIDVVLEDRSGAIACIEVKASATLRERDWRPMAKIRDARSADFRAGFLIHAGSETVPLGDRLWAVPVSALWA